MWYEDLKWRCQQPETFCHPILLQSGDKITKHCQRIGRKEQRTQESSTSLVFLTLTCFSATGFFFGAALENSSSNSSTLISASLRFSHRTSLHRFDNENLCQTTWFSSHRTHPDSTTAFGISYVMILFQKRGLMGEIGFTADFLGPG